MGLLSQIVARATTEPRNPGASRVSESSRTLAGVTITPDTAVTIAAVWACLRYLSQTVAVLPWHVMAKTDRGAEIQDSHPIDWLLWKRPNPEWSSFQFRETLTHWALRHGNGYAEIEPDTAGRPKALWPLLPDRVEVCRATEAGADSYGEPIAAGEMFYEVNNGQGPKATLKARRMFHVRGFGEGPVGVNVINYASQSLGWVRAAQLFGATFFGNGANPSGVVMSKKPLKDDGVKRMKAQFDSLYGGIRRSNKTLFLDNESEYQRIGLNAEETQLVEVHQYLVEEVCRWFGVPPHKVMHLLRATFSNIEHQAIEVVVDSVSPWTKRFEDEADFKLFGQNRLGLYTKMNMRALLRGDFKSQNEGLQIARQNGIVNADEWRDYLDMNAIGAAGGGEKYLMQSQYMTLDKIGDGVAPAPDAQPAAEPDPDPSAAAQATLQRLAARFSVRVDA